MSNQEQNKINTIFEVEQIRGFGFSLSMHISEDKILKAIREMEQVYLKAWSGQELFDWFNSNKADDNFKDFFNELAEIVARLAYCRLLLDNQKITRLKAVEKRNEYSESVERGAFLSEIQTQRLLAKNGFKQLIFPNEAPAPAPFEQEIYLLNEYFVGA